MKETRFKQTEIGLIPEDWEIGKLGSIFKFIPNNTISRDNLVKQGSVLNVHYGDILIKYGSILDIDKNDITFINDSVISNRQFKEFAKDGDILLADTAEDEMVCKATEIYNIKDRKLVSGLHTMWIRPIILFKPKYLGYFFNSAFYHNQILSLIQGTKVCSVSKCAIKDTYICIPLENEQDKIASALTSIDNLLLSLDKLIEKKKLIKQGAMQELLTGKKRLPGFTGEWVEKRLGELTKICTGKRNGDESRVFGKYPFFVRSQKVYRINSFSFEGEAILVPGEGGIGDIFHYINGKFDFHQRVYKISNFNPLIIARYVYYFMKFYFKEYALSQSVKATVESLRLPTFENFIIKFPSNIQEQKAIASVLSSMDKEIESLEGKKAKYEQIKQGMMQQLLTGKIRLV